MDVELAGLGEQAQRHRAAHELAPPRLARAADHEVADAVAGAEGLAALPPGFLPRFVDSTADALAQLSKSGRDPVLIVRASLRPFLAEAVSGVIPNATVLSYQETAPCKKIETVARIAVPAGAA